MPDLNIYMFAVSWALMVGAARQAEDANSSWASGLTFDFQMSIKCRLFFCARMTVHQFSFFFFFFFLGGGGGGGGHFTVNSGLLEVHEYLYKAMYLFCKHGHTPIHFCMCTYFSRILISRNKC